MSLINGMTNMFETREVVMEAAEREFLFEDEMAMEASELIDAMVDGKVKYVSDDEEDSYDLFESLDDEMSSAEEAAALTGNSFLASLNLDKDDPLVTKPGSVGPESSSANFDTNFHDDFPNNNDPLKAVPGSVGPEDSAANFDLNFHDEYEDDNDPLSAVPGSVGPDSSTAKDPVMESVMFFADLVGDEDFAIEGFFEKKKQNKRYKDCAILGIQPLEHNKIDEMMNAGNYKEAQHHVQKSIDEINRSKETIPADKEGKKKAHAADRLLKSYHSMMLKIESDRQVKSLTDQGYDSKAARKMVNKKMKEYQKSLQKAGKLDSASEQAFDMYFGWTAAYEGDYDEAGSIGQQDSAADFKGNYTNGSIDSGNTHPFDKDGSEGFPDSAASFAGNHVGNKENTNDPILTGDGSVGPDSSTAKDPASESYTDIFEELDALEAMMNTDLFD